MATTMGYDQLLSDYEKALATQRWEAVAPLIHEDACFLFNDGTYFGKAAIEAAFRQNFDGIQNEVYQIRHRVWTYVAEACASCTYEFEWSGLINGQAASGKGRGTTITVRAAAGWKIIHEHLGPAIQ